MNKPFDTFKNTHLAALAGYEFNIETQEYEPIKKKEEKLPM